jgi:GPI ethanolamine phosphate transferase 1
VRFRTSGTPIAPFLQHVGTCVGRFGVSHTRPPTESRPGHVALTSGFYEDPSALFSGWKANRVPFDSVFAVVRGAWGFGSPDVVPIWASHGNYLWAAYDAAWEDWSTNTNLFELDTWVFNRTFELLDSMVCSLTACLAEAGALYIRLSIFFCCILCCFK